MKRGRRQMVTLSPPGNNRETRRKIYTNVKKLLSGFFLKWFDFTSIFKMLLCIFGKNAKFDIYFQEIKFIKNNNEKQKEIFFGSLSPRKQPSQCQCCSEKTFSDCRPAAKSNASFIHFVILTRVSASTVFFELLISFQFSFLTLRWGNWTSRTILD